LDNLAFQGRLDILLDKEDHMTIKANKKVVLLLSIFILLLGLLLFGITSHRAMRPSEEKAASKCTEFANDFQDKLKEIRDKLQLGQSVVATVRNSIEADLCVMCRHYLHNSDVLTSELIDEGVPRQVAENISRRKRWREGYYLYFIKNESVVCESHSALADAGADVLVAKLSDKIRFTLSFDLIAMKHGPDDMKVDTTTLIMVIKSIE
jgi:hypothetical protein